MRNTQPKTRNTPLIFLQHYISDYKPAANDYYYHCYANSDVVPHLFLLSLLQMCLNWRFVSNAHVRTLAVVDMTPAVEVLLHLGQIAKVPVSQHLGLEGAMKALVFAQRLRVIGAGMGHVNAQADQPCHQRRRRVPQIVPEPSP